MNRVLQPFKTLESLSRNAARAFAWNAVQSIKQRGRFLVALSGGSTPKRLYQLLAITPYRDEIEWPKVHVFWGDERCVPIDDPENNYAQVRDALLSHVPIPEDNVHRIPSDLEPASASAAYALTLKPFADPPLDWPRFDLVLLGMGDDGHTASLFPNSEVDPPTPTLAVTAHYQGRPANRVTLTPRVFNSAREVIFLVTGANKAETLSRVLGNIHEPGQLPAQRINPKDGKLIWLIDEKAASKVL